MVRPGREGGGRDVGVRARLPHPLYRNLDTGEPVAMPDAGFESVESLAFSPDGPTCAVGGTGRRFAVFDIDV